MTKWRLFFVSSFLVIFLTNLSGESFQPRPSPNDQTPPKQSQQSFIQAQLPGQAHFYNVDSERMIEGTIQQILFEPRYEDRSPFLIIVLKEKKTELIYKVEVSPAWFFDYDLHRGESIKIVGSFYIKDDENFIIARELQVGGQIFRLRDSRGFPQWRGGSLKGKMKRRGR